MTPEQVLTRQIELSAQEDMFDWEVAQQMVAELRNAGYAVIETQKMRATVKAAISDILFDHGTEIDIPGGTNAVVDAVMARLT